MILYIFVAQISFHIMKGDDYMKKIKEIIEWGVAMLPVIILSVIL